MLKSKLGKKLAASMTALAMVASASAASISTLTAFAGEQLGEGTFNEGAGLPWHICENATGAMAFTIEDGVYSVYIKCPGGASFGGEDRWDCQFRHRGLSLTWGNTYRITYSVWASNAGYLYAKIGDIGDDNCEYWHGNGQPLDMSYTEGASLADVASTLKSAATTGSKVEYWNGWDAWKNNQISANKWTTFAYEFQLNKSDIQNTTPPSEVAGTAEWTFHFGGDGQYTPGGCFPEGTVLKFDNLSLVDMTSDKNDYVPEPPKEMKKIAVNQVGYYPNLEKFATLYVEEGDSAAKEFTVEDASGKVVKTGKTSGYGVDAAAWDAYQLIDFSDVTTPGTYKIKCDGNESLTFEIGDDVYDGMVRDAANYFYLNRSGINLEAAYVSGDNKDVVRKAGHLPDVAYLTNEWVFIYTEDPTGSKYTETIDVTGGWYDAGDYGKYVVNGGIAVWTLANIYERALAQGTANKWGDSSESILVPEAGNNIPDLLDEIIWECDFFLKMQRDDGMVYHKMHDYKWTALGVMPYLEDGTDPEKEDVVFPSRIVKPATYAATLNAAAAWAQVARLVKPHDSAKASEYLAAAEKAYAAAKSAYEGKYSSIYADVTGDPEKDDMFAPLDQNKGGGPYGDTNVADEFYWAACELFAATEDSKYYDDVKAYPKAFETVSSLVGGENKGSCSSFNWGNVAGMGNISLSLNTDLLTEAEALKLNDSILAAADDYLDVQAKSGYGSTYGGVTYDITITTISGTSATEVTKTLEGGYEWGSNSFVMNNIIVLGTAFDISGEKKYINGASEGFDYILGRNAMENSYVTGYGDEGYTTENPHHRYWCKQMKSDWPSAPAGCLSGGPNSEMQDPMIQGAGFKVGDLAPMKCYYDQVDAWSVNEITINWNAPLVWVANFMEDEAPYVDEEQDTTPDDTQGTATLYGDTNCDGIVNIADVILLNRGLLGDANITAEGKANADVDQNNTLEATDSLNILKFIVELLDTLPV